MRTQHRIAAIAVTLITCATSGVPSAWGTPAVPSPASQAAESRISAKLAVRLGNPRLGSDVAVLVVDAASGRTVFAQRSTQAMRPASTMKLATAINALSTLGADAAFRTRTFPGPTANSVILQGGGDPLLTTRDLMALADLTAPALDPAAPVIVHPDTALFPPPSDAPGWRRDYVPIVVAPVVALARLGDYSRQPAERAVHQFAKRLRARGFTVTVAPQVRPVEGAVPIAEVADHTVRDAVHLMLRESENNVAEILYRHVAIARGQPPTWEGSRVAAMANLADLGVDVSGLAPVDGSGVSRHDRLTAMALSQVLRRSRIEDPPRFAAMFESSALPIAGISGTLDDAYGRFVTAQARCARGRVQAKTGTLFDTIALSGFTTGQDGHEKLFAILVNDRPQRVEKLATRQAVDGLAATVNGCW